MKKAKQKAKAILPDLRMGQAEFDRLMGKALGVAPEKNEPSKKQRRKA